MNPAPPVINVFIDLECCLLFILSSLPGFSWRDDMVYKWRCCFGVSGVCGMKQRIHRDKLMFHWISKHHEIVVGFKKVNYGSCRSCGKSIPSGESLCDLCFAQDKTVSKK